MGTLIEAITQAMSGLLNNYYRMVPKILPYPKNTKNKLVDLYRILEYPDFWHVFS